MISTLFLHALRGGYYAFLCSVMRTVSVWIILSITSLCPTPCASSVGAPASATYTPTGYNSKPRHDDDDDEDDDDEVVAQQLNRPEDAQASGTPSPAMKTAR